MPVKKRQSDRPDKNGLTPFEKDFCQSFHSNNSNGTQAYLTAKNHKVKVSTAHAESAKLLKKPTIVAEIARLRAELDKKNAEIMATHNVTREMVVEELRKIGFDSTVFEPVQWKDKIRALELLAKIGGFMLEKVEHSGTVKTAPALDLSRLRDDELRLLEKLQDKAIIRA
jgi:hypothetical protein